mgnify:CR=1 FL=1
MMEKINNFINKAFGNTSIDSFTLREDEYKKDNMIYCKKCNTPRTYQLTESTIVRCICKCQEIERDERLRKEEEDKRLKYLEKIKKASLIGERYKNTSFATTEVGRNTTFDIAFKRCKKYCEVAEMVLSEGMGIYLYGDKGTGKTHLMSCMANELMNEGYQTLFTNFFEISKMIRSTFGSASANENEYIDRLANIDFLFIDDLGTERVKTNDGDLWLQEKIFDVLNKRYNMKKPTIFTSNHSLKELISERGFMEKTIDRIAEMSTAIIKVEGSSYRLENRKKEIPF